MLQYEPKIPFRRLLLYIYRCSTVVCFTSGNIDIILNIFKRIEKSMNVQWYYENNLQLFIGGLSKEKKKLWKLSFTNFRILVDHFRGLFLKNVQNETFLHFTAGAVLRNLCRYAKSCSKRKFPRAFSILGGGRTSSPLLYNMGDATHLQSYEPQIWSRNLMMFLTVISIFENMFHLWLRREIPM